MLVAAHRSWAAVYLGLGLALGACEATEPFVVGAPAAMLVVTGQDQTGVVGAELPSVLEVLVTDGNGDPAPGQVVNFRVVSGGGSVFGGAAQTSAAGIAKERWTLGTSIADSQRVEVRAVDAVTGEARVFAVFRATPVADMPANVAKSSGDNQTVGAGATAADSLTVLVTDRFANPVSGSVVSWSAATGAGAVNPATSTTDSAGFARTRWTVGTTVGVAQAVTATVGALPAATFQAVHVAGTATRLALSQPAVGASAGSSFTVQPSVQFVDAFGNVDLAATAPVTMSVSSGASTIGTVTRSPASGVATFANAGLAGAVGDYVLTYSATVAGSPVTVSQPITLVSGTANKYVVTPSVTGVEVGSSVAISAQLTDVSGNAIADAGRAVTWVRTGAGGTFSPATATTNSAGIATTSFAVATTFTSGTLQLAANDGGGLSGSASVSVTPGPASKVSFMTQPVSGGYGIAMSTSVAVTDQYGNLAPAGPSRTITLATSSGMPALEGGTSRSVADGATATFPGLLIYGSGSGLTLTASSPGLASGTSAAFDVSAIGVTTPGRTYSDPFEIAAAGANLYFGVKVPGAGEAQFVQKTGGTTGSLFVVGATRASVRVHGSLVDVLWTSTSVASSLSFIRRISPDNSYTSPLDLNSGPDGSCSAGNDLEFDGTYFFVTCRPFRMQAVKIMRVRASDGAKQTLTTRVLSSTPIALSGGHLFYVDTLGTGTAATLSIKRLNTDGSGVPTTIVDGIGPINTNAYRRLIVVGDTTLVWVEEGTGGVTTGTIVTAPASGGSATPRVTGLSSSVSQLNLDGNSILFNDGGTIKRMSLSDYSVTTVLADQAVLQFTFDDRSIYFFSTVAGPMKKAAK
jgi:hypothetical protein